ncbi:MAG: hypothetical protein ACLP7Q_23515 [Isosphaeraceae bacterium]
MILTRQRVSAHCERSYVKNGRTTVEDEFGWDLLDFLKQAGFRRATGCSIWSAKLGYIEGAGDTLQFVAEK